MTLTTEEATKKSFEAGHVFTPGAPINEKQLFAGRLIQVNSILDAVSQRGYHAVLFGERGVGKTSLSNVLSEFLGTPASFITSRTNCDASDTFSSLWKKGLQDIVISQRKPGVGFTGEDTTAASSIASMMPDNVTPDAVRRLLTDLARSATLVIIFDEFDRIEDMSVKTAMADTIKSLSDYSVDATILIIGVADSVDDLIKEHQSIERALIQIPMPRMSDDEIKEIVTRGASRLAVTFDNSAVDEIASLSQGLPYIAHLLSLQACRQSFGRLSELVSSHDVEQGIEKSLDQWQQSIKSAYYEATKSPQPGHIYKEVLLACALAEVDDLRYFTAASVRKPLRIITGKNYDIPNFARHLKELSDEGRGGILQRVGEKRKIRYRFGSPMLRPYIIMRGFKDRIITKSMLHKIVD
ncbi:MAG: AAA family ATPase [Methylobacterium sp.]|uniref:AAA family ATPase n=1 Tax=Methylobacterium sp. TaxID=409 RepID=UPI002584CAEE|nr:AAA family ATPase [Methylobacterium sp.]MBY0300082.1 AAA family ATPase [Methylobacterium sp.]